MAFTIPQSAAYTVMFKAFLATDHVTEATGKTIAITISKNGGAFGNPSAGATNATEVTSGWYKFTLSTTDTDTLGPIAIRGAVATIDDVGLLYNVTNFITKIDTIDTVVDSIQVDTDNIQTRLPAALVSGRMDSSVGAMAADVITATAIQANAITDAKVASDVTIASVTGSVGSVTGSVGSVTGAVGSVTASVTVGALGAGVITATSIAADAITDAKVASDVTIASVTGAVGSVTGAVGSVTGNVGGNVNGNVVGSVGSVVGAIASVTTVGSVTGAVGSVTGNVGGNVTGSVGSVAANGISASSLSTDAGAEIADAVLDRDMSTGTDSGSTSVRTPRQALRMLRNKWSISAGVLTVTKENDTTASWTATVTGTAGADPITTVDPA